MSVPIRQPYGPGGIVGGPRAYPNQFLWVEVSPSARSLGHFLGYETDWRKARERELSRFDEDRRPVGMLNPMRDQKQF